MKNRYLDLMETTLSAYSMQHINRYFDDVKKNGVTEHGFPRLTANIGILIAHGRRTDLKSLFEEMMDLCCNAFLKPKGPQTGNDFSVKEIVFCVVEIEKASVFPKSKTEYWRSLLRQIQYDKCYNIYAETEHTLQYNWALFSAVSEFMRQYIGIADTSRFVDIQIKTQLYHMDENGMYRDPSNPMVYDLVGRNLFSMLLHFGYDGKYAKKIDDCLKKGGLLTLKMQSVSGEIPYGGRSNQFLHNEADLTTVLEYEASRYAKEGNTILAGRFKAAAEKALANVELWLNKENISHVKNGYPIDSGYGCEGYAYFDKYMITTASFLYQAHILCDESIAPKEEDRREVFSLSHHFHKTFMRNKDWFVQIDTDADRKYEISGIGRIHKKGAPSAICLSTPGTKTPAYKVDIDNPGDFAIASGIMHEGEIELVNRYENLSQTGQEATFVGRFDGICKTAETRCTLTDECVKVTTRSDGDVYLMLPAFEFDGEEYTTICHGENVLEVWYKGWVCRYTADGEIVDSEKTGANRNGHYKIFYAKGKESVGVKIEVGKM